MSSQNSQDIEVSYVNAHNNANSGITLTGADNNNLTGNTANGNHGVNGGLGSTSRRSLRMASVVQVVTEAMVTASTSRGRTTTTSPVIQQMEIMALVAEPVAVLPRSEEMVSVVQGVTEAMVMGSSSPDRITTRSPTTRRMGITAAPAASVAPAQGFITTSVEMAPAELGETEAIVMGSSSPDRTATTSPTIRRMGITAALAARAVTATASDPP